MLRDSRLFSTVTLLKHLAHLVSALIVSLWCCSSFMKFFNYKETQALPTAGIISQIISTLQYLLLGLLLRSVYEVYRALIAIYTYFEAELWPTVLLVLECSLLGISLPILPIHPMIFIMLIWWLSFPGPVVHTSTEEVASKTSKSSSCMGCITQTF
ncbi:uncharacterized protein LOC126202321 isoform X3 [Schistocerca nitens]|uniref:uncharacterized protein LOC126202321 isoform X3 n=1 Tax=Schistocerca nitens TaxID=7011 RepID=UPI00211750C0|nr:uncharacterized protein LOC126202321 isoform X3 [Schistocerca nitens]